MNQRNFLPINKTQVLVAIANVIQSRIASHERQKQARYSFQSWPTFYNFDKLFNLPRSDRWDRRFVPINKEKRTR